MTAAALNDDFRDILVSLSAAGARFVIVGAHAMAVHGVPRATGDLDILIDATPGNALRVHAALESFGAPLEAHGLTAGDFETPGTVYQLGLPPRRIDLMTSIDGVTFDEAWRSRVDVVLQDLSIPVLGRDALIRYKQASGRDKDLLDLRLLQADAAR